MERKAIWIFLAMGLGFGLTVQVLKSAAPTDARMERLARLDALMDEGRPTYHPMLRIGVRTKAVVDHFAHEIVAGLAPAGDKSSEAAPAEAKKEEKKPDAKKDPKKDDKKKKKKTDEKKTDDKAAAAAQPLPVDDTDKKTEASDPSGLEGGVPSAGVPVVAAAPAAALSTSPQSAEEWENFLLNPPSAQAMMKFVTAYHEGQVTSQIFYTVIEFMLADPRDQVREFAVMGLGNSPATHSFVDLATVYSTESGSTKTRSASYTYIAAYANLGNLHYLGPALAPGEGATVNMQAVQMIQLAANHALTTTATTGGGIQTSSTTPSITVTHYFTALLPELSALAGQSGANGTVRNAASNTYAELEKLIGAPATTPTNTANNP